MRGVFRYGPNGTSQVTAIRLPATCRSLSSRFARSSSRAPSRLRLVNAPSRLRCVRSSGDAVRQTAIGYPLGNLQLHRHRGVRAVGEVSAGDRQISRAGRTDWPSMPRGVRMYG